MAALLAAAPVLGADVLTCDERFEVLVGTYDAAVAMPRGEEEYIAALFALEDDVFAAMNYCPDDVNLFSLQGETQIALGRYDLAVLYGEKAVSMAPDSWRAHALLGGALASKGDYDKGAAQLARAVGLAPENLTLKLNLCNAYRLAGRPDQAVPLCEEVIVKGDDKLRGIAAQLRADLP